MGTQNDKPTGTEAQDAGTATTMDALLAKALELGASDIHIDPREDGTGLVRLRIDGVLQPQDSLPKEILGGVIAHLKGLGDLDIAECHLPQYGRIAVRIQDRDLDLRLTSAPTYHGERLVIRILDPEQVSLRLDDILPDDEDRERIRSLTNLANGLVIVNGPTGSGKTTTLYCMLTEANRPGVSVVSVEDPVEYLIPGVVQMQVKPESGFDFLAAQKAVFRQDPDVIMVGEIRDREQINLAVQAAMTGHLVLTTLHAQTSAEAVGRLLNLGLEPFLLNAALKAVISQRLVRKLCPACRKPTSPDRSVLPPEAIDLLEGIEEPLFHAPVGCPQCRETGHRGRTAIHEILVMDEELRRVVAGTADEEAITEAARRGGMKTFLESGMEKAARGIVSVEEVLRVATWC